MNLTFENINELSDFLEFAKMIGGALSQKSRHMDTKPEDDEIGIDSSVNTLKPARGRKKKNEEPKPTEEASSVESAVQTQDLLKVEDPNGDFLKELVTKTDEEQASEVARIVAEFMSTIEHAQLIAAAKDAAAHVNLCRKFVTSSAREHYDFILKLTAGSKSLLEYDEEARIKHTALMHFASNYKLTA